MSIDVVSFVLEPSDWKNGRNSLSFFHVLWRRSIKACPVLSQSIFLFLLTVRPVRGCAEGAPLRLRRGASAAGPRFALLVEVVLGYPFFFLFLRCFAACDFS